MPRFTDEDFMRVALEQALAALNDRLLPVGAVAVLDGEIIAESRKQCDNYRLDHAEMLLLRRISEEHCRGVTVYTTLEPCIMCLGALLHCGIPNIVFALEDPYGGAADIQSVALPERHKKHFPNITGGILRESSRQLFARFFEITDSPFWNNKENPLVRVCLSANTKIGSR